MKQIAGIACFFSKLRGAFQRCAGTTSHIWYTVFCVQNDWLKILLVWHPGTPCGVFDHPFWGLIWGFHSSGTGYLPLETVVWMAGQSHLNQKQTTARLSEPIKTHFIGRDRFTYDIVLMAEILHQIRYQTLQKSGDVNLTGESNGINLLQGSGWIWQLVLETIETTTLVKTYIPLRIHGAGIFTYMKTIKFNQI